MNSFEISRAIKSLRPTAEFSFTDNDYSTIKWDVLEGSAPTWKEIEKEHIVLKNAETKAAAEAAAAKSALLAKLGITEDEAKLLLS